MTTTVVYDMHSEHVTNYSHTTSVCTGSNPLSAAALTVQEGLVRRVREVVKAAIHPSLTIVLHQKITSPLHQKRTAMELIAHPHSTNLPHTLTAQPPSHPHSTNLPHTLTPSHPHSTNLPHIPTAHHTLTAQPSLTPSQHNPPSHPHNTTLPHTLTVVSSSSPRKMLFRERPSRSSSACTPARSRNVGN